MLSAGMALNQILKFSPYSLPPTEDFFFYFELYELTVLELNEYSKVNIYVLCYFRAAVLNL